jgi:hypothetical protein
MEDTEVKWSADSPECAEIAGNGGKSTVSLGKSAYGRGIAQEPRQGVPEGQNGQSVAHSEAGQIIARPEPEPDPKTGHGSRLRPETVVAACLKFPGHADLAAAELKVTVQTFYRWLKTKSVVQQLAEAKARIREAGPALAAVQAPKLVATLVLIGTDPATPVAIRVQACRAALDYATRSNEQAAIAELTERLKATEAKLKKGRRSNGGGRRVAVAIVQAGANGWGSEPKRVADIGCDSGGRHDDPDGAGPEADRVAGGDPPKPLFDS